MTIAGNVDAYIVTINLFWQSLKLARMTNTDFRGNEYE